MRVWAQVLGRALHLFAHPFNGSDMDINPKVINELLESFEWDISHNTHLYGYLIPVLIMMYDIETVVEIGIDRGWITQSRRRYFAINV